MVQIQQLSTELKWREKVKFGNFKEHKTKAGNVNAR